MSRLHTSEIRIRAFNANVEDVRGPSLALPSLSTSARAAPRLLDLAARASKDADSLLPLEVASRLWVKHTF